MLKAVSLVCQEQSMPVAEILQQADIFTTKLGGLASGQSWLLDLLVQAYGLYAKLWEVEVRHRQATITITMRNYGVVIVCMKSGVTLQGMPPGCIVASKAKHCMTFFARSCTGSSGGHSGAQLCDRAAISAL